MKLSAVLLELLVSSASASLYDAVNFLQHPFAHGSVDFTQVG